MRTVFLAALVAWLVSLPHLSAIAKPHSGVYVVDSDKGVADANPGDGTWAIPRGECTLRAAIQEANLDRVGSFHQFCLPISGPQCYF